MPAKNKHTQIFRDGFNITTPIYLSFADRIRILLTGRFCFRTQIVCENYAGKTKTSSVIQIEKVFPEHIRNSFKFTNKGAIENGATQTGNNDELPAGELV
jgi:hypothetical protein